MKYIKFGLKQIAAMDYVSLEQDNISLYDIVMLYITKYKDIYNNGELSFISMLNVAGIIAFNENQIEVNFFNKDLKADALIIYLDNLDIKYDFVSDNKPNIWAVIGKEEELIKKIYVKIEDCPVYLQTDLKIIRENQLRERQTKSLTRARKDKSND